MKMVALAESAGYSMCVNVLLKDLERQQDLKVQSAKLKTIVKNSKYESLRSMVEVYPGAPGLHYVQQRVAFSSLRLRSGQA